MLQKSNINLNRVKMKNQNFNMQPIVDLMDDQINKLRALQGLPKKVNLIVIRKGLKISVHGSFKKACKSYGWDYSKLIRSGVPSKVDGYRVEKIETEVTIESMMIRELLQSNPKITNDFDEDWAEHSGESVVVEFEIHKGSRVKYIVVASFYIREIRDVASTGNAYVGDLDMTTYEADLDGINQIYDEEGDEIPVDFETELMIKNILHI